MSTDTPQKPAPDQSPDHGVPPEALEAESKGRPTSDREQTETAVAQTETGKS